MRGNVPAEAWQTFVRREVYETALRTQEADLAVLRGITLNMTDFLVYPDYERTAARATDAPGLI